VAGSREILRIAGESGPRDLCLCLLSGGGSALLPAPRAGISLADKLSLTRQLSAAGANIRQLNAVRKRLSRIKGGGLARACTAGRLVSLIISDVPGDPLDVIASGPTVEDRAAPDEAREVLTRFGGGDVPEHVWQAIDDRRPLPPIRCRATNVIIGNNATAVEAAAALAGRLGYRAIARPAVGLEDTAEAVGRRLADELCGLRAAGERDCIVSGGEPVVELVEPERRGLGGRNQQLVLAALVHLVDRDGAAGDGGKAAGAGALGGPAGQLVLLSGGTDGEDGPTDAAGALIDRAVWEEAIRLGLDPADYLARNDAYRFFAATGGLVKTGPTDTNVCDVRVGLVGRP
jgi:glycerate-2-kinase